nr:12106_t:CDS:2 [Entrophospora candida]CAG8595714.1 7971_t:CDS:2 [Entrophospora candida]
MSHGKPPHVFNEFFNVNKDVLINKSNFLAICKGCIVRKGFDWSFSEAVRSKISNTLPSIEKHLISCDNFKVVYPNRIEFVNIQLEIIKNKRNIGRTSQANGDVEDDTTIFNNNSQNEVIPIHSNTPSNSVIPNKRKDSNNHLLTMKD